MGMDIYPVKHIALKRFLLRSCSSEINQLRIFVETLKKSEILWVCRLFCIADLAFKLQQEQIFVVVVRVTGKWKNGKW